MNGHDGSPATRPTLWALIFSCAAMVILFDLGEAGPATLDDFYCTDEQYLTCCNSNSTVDVSTVTAEYFSGNNDGGTNLLITWQPDESKSSTQYEVSVTVTNEGRGPCKDSTMMLIPCEAIEGGTVVNDSRFTAENISPGSTYMIRIRVLVAGQPAGLSVCLDSEYSEPRYQIPGRGSVRLANGNSTAGRVEVYLGGQWGTVCDNNWSMTDADVVCRELGFSAAISALGGAYFGEGEGLIQMGDVSCLGTEAHLVLCPFADAHCTHSDDAAAVCVRGDAPVVPGSFEYYMELVKVVSAAVAALGVFIGGVAACCCCRG